jgi:hypothetical protein
MNNLKKLEQKNKELGEEIARLKAENDDVWPKVGDKHFYIDVAGEVGQSNCWYETENDKLCPRS